MMQRGCRLAGWLIWLAGTFGPFKAILWIWCGFDILNRSHYSYVWIAFLAGARFHTTAQVAFLLAWPVLLLWCWGTLLFIPLPKVIGRLLEAALARATEDGAVTAPIEEPMPFPFEGLGDTLPPLPPLPRPAAAEPVTATASATPATAPPVPPSSPAATMRQGGSAAAAAPPASGVDDPSAEFPPLTPSQLLGILDLVPDPARRDEMRAAIAKVDPSVQSTMTTVMAVSAVVQAEYARIASAQGRRPALDLDLSEEAPGPWYDEFLTGLRKCGTRVWELALNSPDRVFLALGTRTIYVILAWARPGEWRDTGPTWTGPSGEAVESPVLTVDRMLQSMMAALEEGPVAALLNDAQALVLLAGEATVVADRAAETRWMEKKVDVCWMTSDDGDRPSMFNFLGIHQSEPDAALTAALDAASSTGLRRVGEP